MMKTFRILYIAVISLLVSSQIASAQIKFDISKTVGKVTTTVSGWGKTAKDKMDQAATLQTMIAMGKGAAETAKALKSQVDSATAMVNDSVGAVKDGVNSVTDAANSAVNTATGAVEGMQNTASDIAGDALSQTGDAQELVNLKTQKMALESERDDEIAAAQEEINGKISLAQENIDKLQDMIRTEPDKKLDYESQIATFETQIKNYEEELKNTPTTITANYAAKIEAVNTQISDLQDKAMSQASGAVADKLGSVISGKDNKAAVAMNEMIENNFLKENDELTAENIAVRRAYRKVTALHDTVAAFKKALDVKQARYANNERAEKLQAQVAQMEGSSSSLGMDIEIKVENIKALLEYTRMMVNDMKMRTANELNNFPNMWKLNRYDKDVSEFNLDDYIYEKESKKQKALDIAKNIKDKGLKGAAEDMLDEEVSENMPESDASASVGQDALDATKAELKKVREKSGNFDGVDEAGVQDITPVNVNEELAQARAGAESE